MNGSAPLIYVVDDDPAVLKGLSRLLQAWDYQVRTFGSAQDFLARTCDGDGAACVVLDVHMPGLSGLELQADLNRARRRLPIVFVTGHGDASLRTRALVAGAVEFLQKPFTDTELLRALNDAISRHRMNGHGAGPQA
jgi:FixJ family two-component response regulator